MATASLESWIDALQSRGRYSFLRSEAICDSGLSSSAVSKALQRAVKRGRLVQPKKYFNVIVPLEYRAVGAPPVPWFIHDLMTAMKRPYYVGLLSAAALHGASHQQPRVFPLHPQSPPQTGKYPLQPANASRLQHAMCNSVSISTARGSKHRWEIAGKIDNQLGRRYVYPDCFAL
jgi:hypothetical protein